jgi:MFS family permease
VAGLSKWLWGYLADRFRSYRTLVVLGYGLSAAMKPLFGITNTYVIPLAARSVDRLGKAIRTAPRDAILAAESKPEDRVRVFGFHRSIDTLGAVVGPALCLLLLFILDGDLQAVFYVAIIPGILATAVAWAVNDRKTKQAAAHAAAAKTARAPLNELTRLKAFKRLVIGLTVFAVINSSDAFLILRLRDLGLSSEVIVVAYMLYNAVYALSAKSTHRLVARVGMQSSMLFAVTLFAVIYGILSMQLQLAAIILVLMGYGFFAGLFEVVSKSWLANVLPAHAKATGIGFAGSVTSLGFLLACLFTGLLWARIGSADTLASLAVLTIVPIIYFGSVKISDRYDEPATS